MQMPRPTFALAGCGSRFALHRRAADRPGGVTPAMLCRYVQLAEPGACSASRPGVIEQIREKLPEASSARIAARALHDDMGSRHALKDRSAAVATCSAEG